MIRKLLIVALILLMSTAASAETFGSETGPLPNVTELRIYDVTGAADKETGGTLVDSGLNKTFEVNQSSEREYRFSFTIKNDGGSDWPIATDDELFHEKLNTSWTVNRIWYNVSSSQNNGGAFSSGRISWDTSNGGTLTAGETMYSKYLVNITESQSWSYDQFFKVNDTSENAGSYDRHELNITKYGYMEMDLLEPPNDTVVRQNKFFVMNSSVTCRNGECGQVDLAARYNDSASSFTAIPEDSGQPFYTNNSNPQTCSTDLGRGETCYASWFVNATGALETYHLLDTRASSSASKISNNDSENHLVQINTAIIMDLTFDTVDFGAIDPGKKNQSAKNNSNLLYNISIDENSDPVDNLWVRATDLSSKKLDYTIPAENLSYSLENDISTESFLSNTFQNVKSNISPGTVLSTFYWIDVPSGIYKGGYNGTIYFKANSTG